MGGRRGRGPTRGALALAATLLLGAPRAEAQGPAPLTLEGPIERWDEALPLGNGLLGGLLWGADGTVNLSLDRGDLWDERLPEGYADPDWTWATIRRLKQVGDQAEISRRFDHPYDQVPYPTKLPGGRLVLHLDAAGEARRFTLDLERAVAAVDLGGGRLSAFVPANGPVALLRVRGPAVAHEFLRPAGLDGLGYPPAVFGEEGDARWMVQEAAEGLVYAVVVAAAREGDETRLAVTIASNRDGQDPLAIGRARVAAALASGWDAALEPHRAWWRDFWSTSSVRVPDERLQRHYDFVRYLYGAGSRPGAPPLPLQGVWTRDDGGLPPWKGDYHHDLNTQTTYLAYHTAGLVEQGRSFLEQQWELLPVYRRFARDFYGVEGAAVPGVATLGGRPTAGWAQYALSPTNGLWVGHSFYLHWRTTIDRAFLEQRAYPWLSAVAEGVAGLLEEREGELVLPLSSSPEIHDNSLAAWLEPNSNYDQALLQWAFEALAEMADALGRTDDAARWRGLRAKLGELLVDGEDVLMFARGEPFDASHRHHSHTMAIHPLGTLSVEGGERERAIVEATLERLEALGTQEWVGYSFSWFACLLARAGRAEEALRCLEDYERAFLLRNGFHVNGDQLGAGLSRFRYRPFTLEGNFLAMEAVHEMLLQGWGGRLRVFPAVSERWADVSFHDLRAEGGWRVSAERRAGRTASVRVTATVDGTLALRDPFGGRELEASRPVERAGDELRCALAAGETLALTAREEPSGPARGEQVVSLAGEWGLRLDPDGAGEAERWFEGDLEGRIALPGTTDRAGVGHALDPVALTYPVPFHHARFPGLAPTERADERGFLVRGHYYLGPAWYQRTIEVPEAWRGKPLRLYLERVLWTSTAWVDGRRVGSCDSLVAPHEHELGVLPPGTHRLTLRVDNSAAHDIGTIGHAYGPETQSRWNGVVGRIELVAADPVALRRLEVHPAPDRRSLRAQVHVDNATGAAAVGTLALELTEERGGPPLATGRTTVRLVEGASVVEAGLQLERPARAWDEFDPTRHRLVARLEAGDGRSGASALFGFRDLAREGRALRVNGRRLFLRGTLDCAVYPRKGHPPTDVDAWLDVLGTVKRYGFNHVRFHTWCPPEAAFEAADRLGLYLAPETAFWVDDWTAAQPDGPRLLGEDPGVLAWVREELRRTSEAYGNHPSFAFQCIGNEFGTSGDWGLVDELLAEAEARDPRRLYSATTARRTVPSDDYWVTHRVGQAPARGVGPAGTDWDFAAAVEAAELPVVAHETGQRPVFPDYDALLPKFDGPLLPLNLARQRERLAATGTLDQVPAFVRASARFQDLQYKAEHEAFHRTAGLAGYQLLMLNDFTGQSEALVGVLDPFWEPKGVVPIDAVRRWNAPTVALARFERFTWGTGETFEAELEAAHHGPRDLDGVTARWSLTTDAGVQLGAGELGPAALPTGGVTRFGRVAVPLGGGDAPLALTLRLSIAGAQNEWRLWAYPDEDDDANPADVLVARAWSGEVRAALAAGRRVLLSVHGLEGEAAKRTGFLSVYWSAGWWGDPFSTLGLLCDPAHPALARFPTAEHSDWQWQELEEGATTVLLDGAPPDLSPIVQGVPDFHYGRRLARVFEGRVGPGRLLVTGYDLERDLDRRRAARQLRRSLLAYAASEDFRPAGELDPAWCERALSSR